MVWEHAEHHHFDLLGCARVRLPPASGPSANLDLSIAIRIFIGSSLAQQTFGSCGFLRLIVLGRERLRAPRNRNLALAVRLARR